MRTAGERVADVRRLLAAAERVYRDRARIVPDLVATTGLTPEGVELGLACLERGATDEALRALVERAGSTAHVHVVLSANVFVAPLRAIAVARAAADRVTVRPSPRDPVLAAALVSAYADDAIRLVSERDVGALPSTEIHVYGRDATVRAVRAAARPGGIGRGHGAGLGVAVVGPVADLDGVAERVASDVVPFDQRGCLSPRVVVAVGDAARAEALAEAIHRRLVAWGQRVPRGALFPDERAEAALWHETMRFAGRLWSSADHAVGVGDALVVPPPGRHLFVGRASTWDAVPVLLAPVARFVVALGCDLPERAARLAPRGARVAALGRMQRPPLDGPVDARPG